MERQHWFDETTASSSPRTTTLTTRTAGADGGSNNRIVFVRIGKELWPARLLREGRPCSIVQYTDGHTNNAKSCSLRDIETVPTVNIVREIPRKRNVGKPKTFLTEQNEIAAAAPIASASKRKKQKKNAVPNDNNDSFNSHLQTPSPKKRSPYSRVAATRAAAGAAADPGDAEDPAATTTTASRQPQTITHHRELLFRSKTYHGTSTNQHKDNDNSRAISRTTTSAASATASTTTLRNRHPNQKSPRQHSAVLKCGTLRHRETPTSSPPSSQNSITSRRTAGRKRLRRAPERYGDYDYNTNDGDANDDDSSIEFLYTIPPPSKKQSSPPQPKVDASRVNTNPVVVDRLAYFDSSDDEVYINDNGVADTTCHTPPMTIATAEEAGNAAAASAADNTTSDAVNATAANAHDDDDDATRPRDPTRVSIHDSFQSPVQSCCSNPFPNASSLRKGTKKPAINNDRDSTSGPENVLENPEMLSSHEDLIEPLWTNNSLCARDEGSSEDAQSSTLVSSHPPSSPGAQLSISFGSSAYLQNLAEICYIVMHDLRWRVGPHNQPLFRWEHGDDLSVVTELSRCFRPLAKPQKKSCRCLLCRDEKQRSDIDDESSSIIALDENPGSGHTRQPLLFDLEDEEVTRPLHLYCRLFYRKGPWFRIDDIYKRYYAPGLSKINGPEASAEDDDHTHQDTAYALSADQRLKSHKDCIRQMLVDLFQLRSTGRLRSFVDEEECGKTVGVALLSSNERATILSKLGCRKAKTKIVRRKGSDVSLSSSRENAIWKQMSQQQSLLNHFKPASGTRALLPVQIHVHELLLTRLVTVAVDSIYRHMDQVPSNFHKETSDELMAFIRETIRQIIPKELAVGITCFRLREAPLRTLQRCSRLFLCSTSGPGNMRGSGDHGWLSLQEVEVSANLPLQNAIPPCGAMWHKTIYPGLTYRFGLSSAPFFYSYLPISPLEPDIDAGDQALKRVFVSHQAFQAWEMTVELRANVDYLVELSSNLRYRRKMLSKNSPNPELEDSLAAYDSVDFLGILTMEGRHEILCSLSKAMNIADFPADRKTAIEQDIVMCKHSLEAEYDQILGGIGALALGVLCLRNQVVPDNELLLLYRRPWLRHLCWEGCLAYILWDIIPFYEKNGMHELATRSLQVLLFGNVVDTFEDLASCVPTRLSPLLLSRRARGKAIDRLIIDFTHLRRKRQGTAAQQDKETLAKNMAIFCEKQIEMYAQAGAISFSALRGIARRLKRPLSMSVSENCTECKELGLRLHSKEESTLPKLKYSDWNPPTDVAVANALSKVDDKEGNGGRCAFVGFEDAETTACRHSSLNVEELAMEFYKTGRLPFETCPLEGGGWCGWHDEGMHIRALFRILCSCPVLGVDWGCSKELNHNEDIESCATIHLSPYQGAPFDLHVGHSEGLPGQCHSFYNRRRKTIDRFLKKLEMTGAQDLSDLVFNSALDRAKWMLSNGLKDPVVGSDLLRVRSLSAVAAGCGGKQLASAFRLLCFDYRHYSGGLPDLTLFRAKKSRKVCNECTTAEEFVAPDVWIGESFSPECQQQNEFQQGIAMLADKDEEFLGCSKVGDSGGSRNRMQTNSSAKPLSVMPSIDELRKLELSLDGSALKVECLMVEVKSRNDRLDPRQEDWLNILDLHGNARVCKFKGTTPARPR